MASSPVGVQHAVSTRPVSASGIRRSGRSVSSPSGVRSPGLVVRGPAVRPSAVHPSSVHPSGVHPSGVQPAGVRPRPSGRVRLVPPQAVALGTRPVQRATVTTRTGRGRCRLPSSRVGQSGGRGGPGRGCVRAAAAARDRRPTRQARPRAEHPSLAAALWAREQAAARAGRTCCGAAVLGWVGDHGAWWSWRPTTGWTGREGSMGVPTGMGVRPPRGPGWQRAFPAR
jgi:hypothetical protein